MTNERLILDALAMLLERATAGRSFNSFSMDEHGNIVHIPTVEERMVERLRAAAEALP